jgi:hypothetical protein
MKRVFLIGNGESRKEFDLESLRPHGKIYGCNALYRDFTPDVLIAVDHGIMHEIYQSGYCYKNETWFREWNRLPGETYELTVYGTINKNEIERNLKKFGSFIKNNRTDETKYVFHGINLAGKINVITKNNEIKKKNIDHTGIYATWVRDDDKAKNISDLVKPRDRGWAAGSTSGLIACLQEKPDEVYLIGHDLNSKDKLLNNIYKDTNCYAPAKQQAIPSVNWIDQWYKLFLEYKNVKFFKVNELIEDRQNGIYVDDLVNRPVLEWEGKVKNLKYIDYKELKRRLTF